MAQMIQEDTLIGRHCLLDIYIQDRDWLKNQQDIEHLLHLAAQAAQAHILAGHFHTFGGDGGITGVLLLAESHISIHTWPEHNYAAVDIFICGKLSINAAISVFQQRLANAHIEVRLLERGYKAVREVPLVK